MSLTAQGFEAKDPCLFLMSTPKHGASAYKRIYHPDSGVCPRPDHIVQDVHKVVHVCKEIFRVKGVFVPGLAGGRVPGKRHTSTTKKASNNWGGKRDRLEYSVALDEESMHDDLKALLDGSDDIMSFFRKKDDSEDQMDEDGNEGTL